MQSSKLEEVLEPLFAFFATDRPFAEVSRLAVVSRNWKLATLNVLKTSTQLSLSGFAESVRDEDVRLALVRVTSENLKRVDLSFCHNISAGCMEHILQSMTCSSVSVKEVDVTACSNEAVLRAVAIRARAVCGVHSALDLYTHLKSLEVHAEEVEQDEEEQEYWKRHPFSYISRLLQASTPLLLFDPVLAPRKDALFQAAAHGTGSDVAMLLSLSFAVREDDESDQDESDQGDMRTYDVNEKDSEGNSPLLLACRSGNFEIAEMLVVAGAGVSAANNRGDTPLLVAVGAGRLELAEMLVSKGADVNAKDSQDNSPLLLACRSGNLEMAEMLVVAGAGVSAANKRRVSWGQLVSVSTGTNCPHDSDTPLLAAVGAGKLALAEMLVSKGANVEAVRMDGAGLLSLVIVSQQPEMLKFALICSPKTLEHHDAMSASELAAAFLDPARIEAWLRTGASPIGLAGQVGALIASCALESYTKNRLEDVRAFLFHNLDILEKYADRDKGGGESRFITLINKREKHLCRSIHRVQSEVFAVCYSPDGSQLARAEYLEVLVCDASTGFVQKTLCGHG
jgi:hypothetical protein